MRDWSMPHFEKALSENSRLLSVYFTAHNLFGRKEYIFVVDKVLSFLYSTLFDKEKGVFFSVEDSDEGYLKLGEAERKNFPPPFVDKTIYTPANAFCASALLDVSSLDEKHKSVALGILEFLWKNNVRGSVLHYFSKEELDCFLVDSVCLLLAFLRAFHKTNRLEGKSRAETIAKRIEIFLDKTHGGFFDIVCEKDAFGRLNLRKKPVFENSLAALAFHDLSLVSKNEKYMSLAQKALDAVSFDARSMGALAASYALALEKVRFLGK